MENKTCYFSIDFEEWFHIPFLEKYHNEENDSFSYCEKLHDFIKKLNNLGIKATIFVVSEIVKKHKDFLIEASKAGNVIACHSSNHKNVKNLSNEEFLEDVRTSKEEIEKTLGIEVNGYRAPMFSASIEKINLLPSLGFTYDSSSIDSHFNHLYCQISENECNQNTKIKEYKIPAVNGFPIGGGGFFRAISFFRYKQFVKKYLKNHNEFVFYVHPYEIVTDEFIGFKNHKLSNDRRKFNIGRKRGAKKIWKVINLLKSYGFVFKTMGESNE